MLHPCSKCQHKSPARLCFRPHFSSIRYFQWICDAGQHTSDGQPSTIAIANLKKPETFPRNSVPPRSIYNFHTFHVSCVPHLLLDSAISLKYPTVVFPQKMAESNCGRFPHNCLDWGCRFLTNRKRTQTNILTIRSDMIHINYISIIYVEFYLRLYNILDLRMSLWSMHTCI